MVLQCTNDVFTPQVYAFSIGSLHHKDAHEHHTMNNWQTMMRWSIYDGSEDQIMRRSEDRMPGWVGHVTQLSDHLIARSSDRLLGVPARGLAVGPFAPSPRSFLAVGFPLLSLKQKEQLSDL